MIAMNAVVLERIDAPLKLSRLERPVPGNGEVLVRAKASGVNPLDIKIRSGAQRIRGVGPPLAFARTLEVRTASAAIPDIDRGRRPDYVPPARRAPAPAPARQMGRSQVVRQRILIPPFPGSNPGAPAS
jgi:hypothetical protein